MLNLAVSKILSEHQEVDIDCILGLEGEKNTAIFSNIFNKKGERTLEKISVNIFLSTAENT